MGKLKVDINSSEIISTKYLEDEFNKYGEIRVILPIVEARKIQKLMSNFRKMRRSSQSRIVSIYYDLACYFYSFYQFYYQYRYPKIEHVVLFYLFNVKVIQVKKEKIGTNYGAYIFKRKTRNKSNQMDRVKGLRRKWEGRFPSFNGEWSHWKITGDDTLLEVVNGMDLFRALDLTEENFEKFKSIKAVRVILDSSGNILQEEKHKTEISNSLYLKDVN